MIFFVIVVNAAANMLVLKVNVIPSYICFAEFRKQNLSLLAVRELII